MSIGTILRLFLFVYAFFFAGLTTMVVNEALSTTYWTHTGSHTWVFASAIMAGWFDKLMLIFNSLFGVGGGVLTARPGAGALASVFAVVMPILCCYVGLSSLVDIVLISFNEPNILKSILAFNDANVPVKDAVTALGAMNLSIVAGFVAGVGAANTSLVK